MNLRNSSKSMGVHKIRSAESGFTLIEVLVSLVIFSFAVLGLIAMQSRAIQVSYDAENRMRASLMGNEIASAMWAANTVSLSSSVISAWQTRVSNTTVSGLPVPTSCTTCGGTVTVGSDSTTAYSMATITIKWQAPSQTSPSQYVTIVEMPPPQ